MRRLERRPAQHVAQQKGGALPWRQKLDRGDEGELYGFAGFVARVRAGRAVDEIRQFGVRVGLQPGELNGGPAGRAPLGRRASRLLENAMH